MALRSFFPDPSLPDYLVAPHDIFFNYVTPITDEKRACAYNLLNRKENNLFMRESSAGFMILIEKYHFEALQKADQFYELLSNLRYEGKAAFGRNTHGIQEVLKFFRNELLVHISVDEDIVFAFAETHIPRLKLITGLLRAEHAEFKSALNNFELLFIELQEAKNDLTRSKIVEQLKDKGTYITYLLRNHIQAESESIYKILDAELHMNEKKTLFEKMKATV